MCRKSRQTVREPDRVKLEDQLAFQCAPLILGLRMANLLIIRRCYLLRLCHLLEKSCIRVRVLYAEEEKLTILLYHWKRMDSYIAVAKARALLQEEGYDKFDVDAVLIMFAHRYRDYREGMREFPHELGLLLGYPIEDVEGYIRNNGKNFLYAGYWKVYANVPDKRHTFRMFEMARETLEEMLCGGASIQKIIETYCGRG